MPDKAGGKLFGTTRRGLNKRTVKKKNKQKGKQEKKIQKKPNFVDRALVEENQLKISLTVIYNKFL